jgi:hypothetical protein
LTTEKEIDYLTTIMSNSRAQMKEEFSGTNRRLDDLEDSYPMMTEEITLGVIGNVRKEIETHMSDLVKA